MGNGSIWWNDGDLPSYKKTSKILRVQQILGLRDHFLAKFQSEMYHPNVEVNYQGKNPQKARFSLVDGRKRWDIPDSPVMSIVYTVYLYLFTGSG